MNNYLTATVLGWSCMYSSNCAISSSVRRQASKSASISLSIIPAVRSVQQRTNIHTHTHTHIRMFVRQCGAQMDQERPALENSFLCRSSEVQQKPKKIG